FVTDTDTEVILAAVQEKGLDWFLSMANGMFAIALYNSRTKNLYLVRDRLGIKPLYYYHDGKNLIFASEIKAILSSGLIEANFDEQAVADNSLNRYVRDSFAFFKNIKQLPAEPYYIYQPKAQITEKTYCELPKEFNMTQSFNENELQEH